MSYPVYTVPAGDVLPIFFDTFDGGTGASITMTGLAVTDIEIYKDGSVTQRASDAGYTLLDTDGIDFDSITGIHGFSIDTGDNTDAGFYTVGAWYHVVVSAITVDAQTVNFIAAAFRIVAAEDAAGVPDVNVTHFGGSAGTFASGRPDVNTTHLAGTAQTGNDVGADVNEILLDTAEIGAAGAGLTNINLPDQTMNITGDITGNLSGSVGSVTGAVGSVTGAVGSVTGAVGSVTGNVGGNVVGSVGSVATGGITSGSFAAGALDAVWSVATRTLTAFDSSFKTGYALSAAGVQAIWDALTSALTTVGSIGKLLVDNLNATISSRASQTTADAIETDTQDIQARLPAALSSGRMDASVGAYQTGLTPLQPTVAGRTLDVSVGGEAGVDWANVGSPTTAVGLTGTTISTSQQVASVSGAVGSVTGNVGGLSTQAKADVNAEADTALADVGLTTTVTGRIDAAVSTRATPAQVNAEVVDALNVDTYAEPGQGAPAATLSLAAKIGYLFKSWRNKKTNDGTDTKLYADDATTVDQKQTTSESGGTVTKGEWTTGP